MIEGLSHLTFTVRDLDAPLASRADCNDLERDTGTLDERPARQSKGR